ncbi:MAG: histidine kinase [Chromatiales bacterium]|nr:histidine kinase [Chromatiales bacterium]
MSESRAAIRGFGLFGPVAALVAFSIGGVLLAILSGRLASSVVMLLALIGLGGVAVSVWWLAERVRARVSVPVAQLRAWTAVAERGVGEEPARVSVGGPFAALASDLNELIELYCRQKKADDARLRKDVRRLAQKTSSLNILYDIAARINEVHDVDELTIGCLRRFKRMVDARSATLNLRGQGGNIQLFAAIDEDDRILTGAQLHRVPLCLCGRALGLGERICDQPQRHCETQVRWPMYRSEAVERVRVPIDHSGERLGYYDLFVARERMVHQEEAVHLLETVGAHLGTAVKKSRLVEQAARTSLLHERSNIAHELHDSLAQSLTSLRYQSRTLAERVARVGDAGLDRQVERISSAIDEAHGELRSLIAEFREPMDHRGLVPALTEIVDRFRRETGVRTFFQAQCREPPISPNHQLQVLRIVQEALANVRQHSQARNLRVMLRRDEDSLCRVLIEDDGVGFDTALMHEHLGEHIGLSVLEERAYRLGGQLRIESEPGEGTQIELIFGADPSAPRAQSPGV